MAIQLLPEEKDIWKIVQAVIQLVYGRDNAHGHVTLRANQATTVVTHPNCSNESEVLLTPKTANAAAALATTYVPAATTLRGSFTINHANNGQTDKTFSYSVRGG